MRRFPFFTLIFFSLSLVLAACQSASPVATQVSISPSPYPPPASARGSAAAFPSPSAPVAFTPAQPLSETVDNPAQPDDPALLPCSPLAEHSLTELPEIVSSPYNPPPMGSDARHQGVDFSYYRRGERTSILGVGIQSVFAGRVAAAIADRFPYGNAVIIETLASELPSVLIEQLEIQADESLYTLYAHMGAAPILNLGDDVITCQPLGEVGKSGNAGIPHLHLEMRIGRANQQLASMAFYSTQTSQEERDNYVLWRMSGEFRHFDPMSVLIP